MFEPIAYHDPYDDLPPYDPESGDVELDDLMRLAYTIGYGRAREQELRAPVLVFGTPDGTISSFNLLGARPHPSDVARVLLAGGRAERAALCFESWEVDVPTTPEIVAQIAAGHSPLGDVSPSEHPDRFDALVVIGERRGRPQLYHSWRLLVPLLGLRHLAPLRHEYESLPSRFNPLLVDQGEVRQLIRDHAELARLRATVRQARN